MTNEPIKITEKIKLKIGDYHFEVPMNEEQLIEHSRYMVKYIYEFEDEDIIKNIVKRFHPLNNFHPIRQYYVEHNNLKYNLYSTKIISKTKIMLRFKLDKDYRTNLEVIDLSDHEEDIVVKYSHNETPGLRNVSLEFSSMDLFEEVTNKLFDLTRLFEDSEEALVPAIKIFERYIPIRLISYTVMDNSLTLDLEYYTGKHILFDDYFFINYH